MNFSTQWSRALIALALALGVVVVVLPARAAEQLFPDVIAVQVQARGVDTFDFEVTVSSPYDTPQRYADAFRAMGNDGKVYGVRRLLHDHAGEQPFTRELYGVAIPASVRSVVIQGRDQRHGWGGGQKEVRLPGR